MVVADPPPPSEEGPREMEVEIAVEATLFSLIWLTAEAVVWSVLLGPAEEEELEAVEVVEGAM
jgi:hypothetical protein